MIHAYTRTDGPDVVVPQAQLLQRRALATLHPLPLRHGGALLAIAAAGASIVPVAQEEGQRHHPRVADVIVAGMSSVWGERSGQEKDASH